MKQIFDWLREQIGDKKENCSSITMIDVNRVHNIIDEAEAKWEADCCEQWYLKENATFMMIHGTSHLVDDAKYWKFCPYCGKPIKISGVE
jgi:hypothetical protein